VHRRRPALGDLDLITQHVQHVGDLRRVENVERAVGGQIDRQGELRGGRAARQNENLIEDGLKRDGSATVPNVAKDAYRMADAMLAARGEA